MPQVTFHPPGISGGVPEGSSLLEAAEMLGVPLNHVCGGNASCSTCRVHVVEGWDLLTGIEDEEKGILEREWLDPPYRLACQARVKGDVVVTIPPD